MKREKQKALFKESQRPLALAKQLFAETGPVERQNHAEADLFLAYLQTGNLRESMDLQEPCDAHSKSVREVYTRAQLSEFALAPGLSCYSECELDLVNCLFEVGHLHRKWLSCHDEALFFYKQAERLQPTNPVVHFFLGLTYKALAKPSLAYQHYSTALHLDPTYSNAYFNLGNLYLENQEAAQAVECYEAALESFSNQSLVERGRLYYMKAQAFWQLGKAPKALRTLIEGAEADPLFARLYQLGAEYAASCGLRGVSSVCLCIHSLLTEGQYQEACQPEKYSAELVCALQEILSRGDLCKVTHCKAELQRLLTQLCEQSV